jgi:hypothetical protein
MLSTGLSCGRSVGLTEGGAAADERPEQGWQLADAAERLHVLGIHRPADGAAIVMVPSDSAGDQARALGHLDDGPERPPANIVTSRFTAADVRELLAAVAERDWSPEAKRYRYGFSYDAGIDAILISTSAPEAERRLIAGRFGDRVQISHGKGGSRR